jgi:hypothetical protein
VCSQCVKSKWGWDVAAITADPRRRALYERLGRENPMTAPHHVELSEQLSDLAGAHRTSTAVGVFDYAGLERARGAGDKSILCPLHQRQVNLVQLFGGEAGPYLAPNPDPVAPPHMRNTHEHQAKRQETMADKGTRMDRDRRREYIHERRPF